MEQIANSFLSNNPEFGSVDNIQKIGSGYNGAVFLTDKNFVIKVTGDKEEFDTSVKIFNKANGLYTPKYHKLERVDGYFIIVMDRIKPINLTSQQNVLLNLFRDKMLDLLDAGVDILPLKEQLSNIGDSDLEFILSGLIDCAYGLQKIGIKNADIHEDNIGISNGKIVLIDVVDQELVQEVKILRRKIREIINEFFN